MIQSVSVSALRKGLKYRIRYKSDTHRVEREAVMTFIGHQGSQTAWSARPVAGTQIMPNDWVVSIATVDADTACYLDRKVPK